MSYAATFKREKVSAKHLIVGMKCGGSDGLSGITANPTVGLFSDMLVSKGGYNYPYRSSRDVRCRDYPYEQMC